MGKIAVLDKLTIDQIAAGEVVESPLNVVKELVENAIDAGADSITVEIKDGGISYIRVTDNGSGIMRDDLDKAFLRHSTSKLRSAEELSNIHTLGFRGEALSSISAVSEMEVYTKTRESMLGYKVRLRGGDLLSIEETGTPDGTSMIVRNLFFNTPARKKFLKSDRTMASHVVDLMEHLSMSHCEISFQLIVNGSTKLHTPGNGNLLDVIYRIYGKNIVDDLLPMAIDDEGVKINGYIAKPGVSRGNRNYENFFVNNRYVQSKVLSRGLEEGYKTFIMQHKFPFAILSFDFPDGEVDVNVHPTKMEVRFQREEELYDILSSYVKRILANEDLITKSAMADHKYEEDLRQDVVTKAPKAEPFQAERLKAIRDFVSKDSPYEAKFNRPIQPKFKQEKLDLSFEEEKDKQESLLPKSELVKDNNTSDLEKPTLEQEALITKHFLDEKEIKNHRIIGQVFDTYWLVEFNDSLYIIDQHAAHERILFERTMKSLENKEVLSTPLCPPMVLSLSDRELLLLEKYEEEFTKIGFSFENFGGKDVIINEVPYNMFGIDDRELFVGMLDELTEFSGRENSSVLIGKIAMMSCKAAVKGNQKLSQIEAEHIINELLSLENPYHCPHGRPTIIEFSKNEMERRFHR